MTYLDQLTHDMHGNEAVRASEKHVFLRHFGQMKIFMGEDFLNKQR